ncbi:MAG: class I SAM-dependent methyltransferase [bacterium]
MKDIENDSGVSIEEIMQSIKDEVAKRKLIEEIDMINGIEHKLYKPAEDDRINFPQQRINFIVNDVRVKSQVRTKIPNALNRFPVNKSKFLQKIILKFHEHLFREQREVNNEILDILQELSAIQLKTTEEINIMHQDTLQAKFNELDGNIDTLQAKFNELGDNLNGTNKDIDKLQTKFNELDGDIDVILRAKFNELDGNIDTLQTKFNELGNNVNGTNKDINISQTKQTKFNELDGNVNTTAKVYPMSTADTTAADLIKTAKNCHNLIKIDFKDDPDYTYHNLELALRQADFILVDGYFKSKDNMLSSAFFLEKYKDLIESCVITPGYSGELLIKTNEKAKKLKKNINIYDYSYKELESFYDENYYLTDCGGYESFNINNAVLDNRLYVVQCLANARSGEKILDLGCGRGELSYAIAKSGADVLGIDYSGSSIDIAKKNFNGRLKNLNYKKIDFFELDPGLLFDKIVASDLVEHIDADLFEKFMEQVVSHLSKDGKFILHTAPNKYVYSHKYKQDRLKAKEIGLYLPENPRSFYESLMHINEQTPGSLKKVLKKYFKCFYVWTANTPEDPLGNLSKKPIKAELINQRSIFAITSNSNNIDKEDIINLLTQDEIKDISGISLELLQSYSYPKKIKQNTFNTFKLKLINNSGNTLKSLGKFPINLSYHIKDIKGNYIVYDGIRTDMPYSQRNPQYKQINPVFEARGAGAADVECNVQAPDYTGTAIIEFTMLQEGCFWFENKKDGFIRTLEVEIV